MKGLIKNMVILIASAFLFSEAMLNGMTNTILNTDKAIPHASMYAVMFSPVTQASGLTFTNVQPTSMTLSWTRGSGDSCLVFIKQATTGTPAPLNGTSYTANAAYPTGQQIATSGWYCVYNGVGTTVNITGLTSNNTYRVMVCEYDGTYNVSSSAANLANRLTLPSQVTNLTFSTLTSTSMKINWPAGVGGNKVVFVKEFLNAGETVPLENGIIYTANAAFKSGTQIGITGWYCVYKSTGTSVTVTGLSPNVTYQVMVCNYNGTSPNLQYNINPAPGNPSSQVTLPTQATGLTFGNVQTNQMDISWIRGNGTNCAVFMLAGSTGVPVLSNQTTYVANSDFLNPASSIGGGWYCIYNGNGTNVTATNISPGVTYRVFVCEYSGIVGNEFYNIANSAANLGNKLTLPSQATDVTFSLLGASQMNINWNMGAGANCIVFVKQTTDTTETASPVYGTNYNANSVFKSGNQIGTTGWWCVYKGTNTFVTITNLASGTRYQVMVIVSLGSGGTILYNTIPNPSNPKNIITKGFQIITFPVLPVKNYGDADFSPGATASSGLPVSYFITDESVATLVNGKIHIVGVGSTEVLATQDGNSEIQAAPEVIRTLVVNKGIQSIILPDLPVKTFNDPDFDAEAYSDKGTSISYSSSNPSVAVIAWGLIRIVGAGTANITASNTGNPYYANASATKVLTVSKAPQTITFPTLPVLIYGCEDYYPDATSTSGLEVSYESDNLSVAAIVNGRIHVTGTGSANITAKQLGNSNYLAAPSITLPLTVNKDDQTIVFDELPIKTYTNPDFTLPAVASSGLPISFSSSNPSVATVTGDSVHIVGAGTTIITASQAGNSNYNPAGNVAQSLVVNKASQTITFNSFLPKIFGDADFPLTASSSAGLALSYASDNTAVATIVGGNIHIVSTGTANITASQTGNTNYLGAVPVTQRLVVKSENQTITFDSIVPKTYGDADFTISATSSSGLPLSFIFDNPMVATFVNGKVHIVGSGTVNIIATQDGDNYYNAAPVVSRPLVVKKAGQAITFPGIAPKFYTDADFSPGATSNKGLPVTYTIDNANVAIIVGDKVHIVGVGTATITAHQAGNNNYSAAVSEYQTLTVSQVSQTVTFNALPAMPYGTPDFSLTATASSGLEITYQSSNTNVATVTNGVVHIKAVGSTQITAAQVGNSNFLPASRVQTLIVTKANQTITFAEIPPKTYGDDDFSLDAVASSNLPVMYFSSNPNAAKVVNGWVQIVGAGLVTITAVQAGNSNYNLAPSVSRTFVISKHSQQIYFDTIPERTYGDADFDPGAVASSWLTVTYMSDKSSVATVVAGKIHIVGAGTATITAYQLGDNTYSPAVAVSQLLIVKKAPLTAIADNMSRKYNTANPAFTCSYTGFVNGDNATGIDAAPTVTTTATISSNPGKYSLIPQGGTDNNYTFNYQNGDLIILGTTPLKPSKPFGNSLLCINPLNQTYSTSGGIFSTNYVWELLPSNAGTITGIDKSATVNFNDSFTGKAYINVKGKNTLGVSESSDTLVVNILPVPSIADLTYRGRYCSNNPIGDSVLINYSQPLYTYQLLKEGNTIGQGLVGDGSKIGWYDLKMGTYSITETLCNVVMDDEIVIAEVNPTSAKPQLQVKWNDVLVCVKTKDSIINYQWYKDGLLIEGEYKQFLWTQQKKGNYAVKTTDDSGCQFLSDDVPIAPPSNGLVYPNPNHGQFKVSFTDARVGQVIVRVNNLNSLPVKSFTYQKENDTFEQEITLSGQSSGVYYIDVILNGERVFYEKLIIE